MKTLFSFRSLAAIGLLWTLSAAASAQSVTLTAPSNGATYTLGSPVNLTATKTGATLTKVRFKQNGTVISTDSSSPYTASFTPGTSGSYALVAEGLNSSNTVIATSATVNVTVSSPTVSATRSYVYDQYKRLCKVIEPERGATIIEYDAASNIVWTAEGTNLTSTTDCQRASVTAGQKVSRTYDAMNRVTAVSTPGGTADVTTTYYADGLVNTLTAANPGGNNVTTTYTYNKRRMLTGETSTNGATSVFSLGYGYNNNGHLGAITYPDGKVVSYAPDALGRATAITDSDSRTYASAISYFPNGAIQQFTYGNGIVHTMTKNARQLPSRSQDLDGSTKILDDTYTFDANGNVDTVTDALPATATNRTRDLGYDALDRLIVADAVNQWGQATFSYDALDNIRSADVGTRQYRYNYDANNRLLDIKNPAGVQQFAFTYDARGNTLTKTGQAFAFDYGNRLNEVTGSQVYRYDGQGRRVQTTDVADSKTTFWIYSQSGQVLYTSEARRNQNISYIYLGNTQVATKTVAWSPVNTTTIAYQHTDSLGSIVAETNQAKAVIKRNSYEPYGGAWNSTIDGTGYTGHVMDQATGLTYMQQRYYDPQVGRFLSTDPMVSDPNSGAMFNRYSYANNSPQTFKDPDGRFSGHLCDLGCDSGSFDSVAPSAHGSRDTSLSARKAETDEMQGLPYKPSKYVSRESNGKLQEAGEEAAKQAGSMWVSGRIGKLLRWLPGGRKSGPKPKIGSTGKVGEDALKALGGRSQVGFKTSTGWRYVDQLVDGIAHESKVGYNSLTPDVKRQIAKDAELIRTGQIDGAAWHFFQSPKNGSAGPSKPLLELLESSGIDVIYHY